MGRHVEYQGRRGVVIGVGDDGYMSEFDHRRRAKPNGTLFVRRSDSATIDKPLDFECVVILETT